MDLADHILKLEAALNRQLAAMSFSAPVSHVYNPLLYADAPHQDYVRRYARPRPKALLLGMNPGPFGMAQTGVPFGEVSSVKTWLAIDQPVGQPERVHPKRPIQGFQCTRSEVSGQRLWTWARQRWGQPERPGGRARCRSGRTRRRDEAVSSPLEKASGQIRRGRDVTRYSPSPQT